MGSSCQQRYWKMFVEARVHTGYLYHFGVQSEKIDKAVNIFLAVTSSSSIAAWALWKEFTWIWPLLIAAAQVVSAVKPFLPYDKRRKAVVLLSSEFQSICLQIESKWFSVAEGLLSEQQIHEETINFKNQILKAERRFLDGEILPRKPKLLELAENEAKISIENHYGES